MSLYNLFARQLMPQNMELLQTAGAAQKITGRVRNLHRCHDIFIINNICDKGNQSQRAGDIHDCSRHYLHCRNIEIGDHKDDHSHLAYSLGLAPHICGDDNALVGSNQTETADREFSRDDNDAYPCRKTSKLYQSDHS